MATCQQHWPPAVHQAKAASPSSACGSEAAYTSARQRNSISSGLCRRYVSNAASPIELFATRAPAGSLAICPAGIDSAADAEESVDALLIAIDPGQLALAAAEGSALEARLNERNKLGMDTFSIVGEPL